MEIKKGDKRLKNFTAKKKEFIRLFEMFGIDPSEVKIYSDDEPEVKRMDTIYIGGPNDDVKYLRNEKD